MACSNICLFGTGVQWFVLSRLSLVSVRPPPLFGAGSVVDIETPSSSSPNDGAPKNQPTKRLRRKASSVEAHPAEVPKKKPGLFDDELDDEDIEQPQQKGSQESGGGVNGKTTPAAKPKATPKQKATAPESQATPQRKATAPQPKEAAKQNATAAAKPKASPKQKATAAKSKASPQRKATAAKSKAQQKATAAKSKAAPKQGPTATQPKRKQATDEAAGGSETGDKLKVKKNHLKQKSTNANPGGKSSGSGKQANNQPADSAQPDDGTQPLESTQPVDPDQSMNANQKNPVDKVTAAIRRASTNEIEDKEAKRKAYKARKQRFYNSLTSTDLNHLQCINYIERLVQCVRLPQTK